MGCCGVLQRAGFGALRGAVQGAGCGALHGSRALQRAAWGGKGQRRGVARGAVGQ